MALVIRFRKVGKNNRQSFRLVVTDKRNPRDGKYVEMLGWYNPFGEDGKNLSFKTERIEFWLSKGAQISENVKSLLKKTAPQIVKSLNEKKLKKRKAAKPEKKAVEKAEEKESKVEKKAAKPKKATKAKAKK
jgi:small subunit ribosomal protein S16